MTYRVFQTCGGTRSQPDDGVTGLSCYSDGLGNLVLTAEHGHLLSTFPGLYRDLRMSETESGYSLIFTSKMYNTSYAACEWEELAKPQD